jgi:thioesterase domain-containing protein
MNPLLEATERFFHGQIPLTRAMGVRVEAYDGRQLVLSAPLEMNHNHLGTAFGGSLAALATLAGYGLLWLELGSRDAHIVIRRSELDYRRPVTGPPRAICRRPDDAVVAEFKTRFGKTGKARIRLHVTVEEEGRVCMAFEGTFVAVR